MSTYLKVRFLEGSTHSNGLENGMTTVYKVGNNFNTCKLIDKNKDKYICIRI